VPVVGDVGATKRAGCRGRAVGTQFAIRFGVLASAFSLITSNHLMIVLGMWFVGALVVLGGGRARKR